LEVRWLRPGPLAPSLIEWFRPFVDELETREDAYLVAEHVQGISVKIRGGARLDIKVTGTDGGLLEVDGHARGRTQYWTKWSFPTPGVSEEDVVGLDWVRVGKCRRIGWFSVRNGVAAPHGEDRGRDNMSCAVEVTEVLKDEERWWTIGFEAAGDHQALRGTLDATATLLLGNPLPTGLELRLADSISYSEWLETAHRRIP
jgi:hypothetical protein